MLEFRQPIPVVTQDGYDGFALYVTNSVMYEDDIWCIVLCDGGHIRHYKSSQIKIHSNSTFTIRKLNI